MSKYKHVSPKGDLAYLSVWLFQIIFSKLYILDENLPRDKHENVNIVHCNPPLVASVVIVPRTDNDSFKLVAFEENSLQGVGMQSFVFKWWVNILEEETSNSDSNDHDDLVQSPHKLGRSPKNASIAAWETTEITFHCSSRVKLDYVVVANLEVKGLRLNLFGLYLIAAGSCHVEECSLLGLFLLVWGGVYVSF